MCYEFDNYSVIYNIVWIQMNNLELHFLNSSLPFK
jgi:hypothetical protein